MQQEPELRLLFKTTEERYALVESTIRELHPYDLPAIRHWLEVFCKRFFASQFKRSALPNGPKVSAGGSLSPRGDWRMPSDASAAAWLAELERTVPTA